MRSYLLGFLLLLGCQGENVVAGEEKSKAEQLEAVLPSWCQSICHKLQACPGQNECVCEGDLCDCTGTIGDDCPEECAGAMARWAQGSDECAAVGQSMKSCIDQNGCDVISVKGLCQVSEIENAMCPDSGSEDVSGGSNGSSETGAGGAPSVSPIGDNPLVQCQESFGSGGGAPATPTPTPQLICEQGQLSCSDGHEYRVLCVTTSEGPSSCSCFVDDQVTRAFDPAGVCPSGAQINAGCGWYLIQ